MAPQDFSATLTSLPPELISSIISHISDRPTLCTLSLLSRTLLYPAQAALHSSLSFSSQSDARSWLTSPTSGEFMTTSLRLVGNRRVGVMGSAGAMSGGGAGKLGLDKVEDGGVCIRTVRAVLGKVRGLKALELHCMDDWSPGFLMSPLLKNLQSLSLCTDFHLPSNIPTKDLPDLFQPYFRLTHLAVPLSFPYTLLPLLLSSRSTSALTSLSLSSYTLQQFLTSCTSSLSLDLSGIEILELKLFSHPANDIQILQPLFRLLGGVKEVRLSLSRDERDDTLAEMVTSAVKLEGMEEKVKMILLGEKGEAVGGSK